MRGRGRGIVSPGAALAALWLAALVSGPAAASSPDRADRFDTVVIDAGHGGDDTGARGPLGHQEKDVVLAVARNLAVRLREHGLQVVLTRDSDEFVPLEQRTAIANDLGADLFLSIHANASPQPGIGGTETYFLALEASDAAAASVAERENRAFVREGEPPIAALSDPFIALIGDLIATEHLEESNAFARQVQEELGELPLRSRGVKQAMFVVLSGVQMPAALVEIGFITNRADERRMTGSAGRDAIVAALADAVLAYGRRYDARRGGAARQEDE